jgi:hypothetical protein
MSDNLFSFTAVAILAFILCQSLFTQISLESSPDSRHDITKVSCDLKTQQVYDRNGTAIDQIVVGQPVNVNETFHYEVFHYNETITLSYVNMTVQIMDYTNKNAIVAPSVVQSKVAPNDMVQVSVPWTPHKAGLYYLQVDFPNCQFTVELDAASYPHPFNVSNFAVGQNTPSSNMSSNVFYIGHQSLISETIENRAIQNASFTFMVEVIDSNTGYTAYLSTTDYNISGQEKIDAAANWVAETAGIYTIKTLVVDNLVSPQILAEPQNVTLQFVGTGPKTPAP